MRLWIGFWVGVLVLHSADPAGALGPDGASAGATSGGDSASVIVGTGGDGGQSGSSGESPYVSCTAAPLANWLGHQLALVASTGLGLEPPPLATGYPSGTIGISECDLAAGGTDLFLLGFAPPSGADAAALAAASLTVGVPDVATSPPAAGIQLVGVPTWFWVDDATPVGASASLPGVSATVTATPGTLHLDLGDGTTIACPGRGNPYDPGRSSKGQETDCSHTYDRHGDLTVQATLDWAVTWTATTGESGTLPTISRSTTLPLHVEEAQAVVG